jgi:hypothetical protein
MSRQVPNIDIKTPNLIQNRQEFKSFVLKVITDTFIYQVTPDHIALDGTGKLFTLYLYNKRLIEETLQLEDYRDYVDVYLFGVKQPQSRYNVTFDGLNITIVFNQDITRVPEDVVNTDFLIKGKIVDIV